MEKTYGYVYVDVHWVRKFGFVSGFVPKTMQGFKGRLGFTVRLIVAKVLGKLSWDWPTMEITAGGGLLPLGAKAPIDVNWEP